MKYLIGFCIILLSFTAFSKQDELDFKAWEKTGQWGIYDSKPDSHFNPLKIKKYKEGYLPSFSYLIKLFNLQNVNNQYCLIGYKMNKTKEYDGFESVIVFWKTANYLIDWDLPNSEDDHSYKAIIFSKPFIDMNESVVPYKEAEGAQALWAKEGVIQMMNDCELNGQKITITPSGVR
ncbi:hypothetical protein [Xenorhabdus bovienii]|uniref:hypothetical protein n=1 Tax=Xenorhabdus bovienii TaxID=40576 RepID=UPI00237C8269|nr:hypothetical protein [Xenorhabdus bovienii]MDE1483018.1 hypothetical protein [Xenorhabdus bovienii]MDE9454141.1 hypothetical protein [Xenorhabdus bovienii]MDE9459492.1 hypothetical protein [Xenorhabdus bovienii]MDE9480536.1 hypothetical protein [Xenorhabdus bovienii]MDE9487835.1 hypothetical protein [Xenorhabdus bovienii]